jgi:hypothetical protein
MKRYLTVVAVFFAFALALVLPAGTVPARAANLENLNGQSCGDLLGTWHFVNNQTGGAPLGTLTAIFTSGTCTDGGSAAGNNVQHFFCVGFSGELLSASTDLPGRLVLSDFTCDVKKPPPCDPKTDPLCK